VMILSQRNVRGSFRQIFSDRIRCANNS
jgi:hypothetical protein